MVLNSIYLKDKLIFQQDIKSQLLKLLRLGSSYNFAPQLKLALSNSNLRILTTLYVYHSF